MGLLTAGVSAIISIIIVLSQKWHGRHTLDHDLNGVQKFHAVAVPRVGGIAIVGALAFVPLFEPWQGQSLVAGNRGFALTLLAAGLPVIVAGLAEDLTKKVSVRTRLVASIVSALAASWFLGATIDALDIWGVDHLLTWMPVALVVTAVTVSGGVNSINIIDGFNGLASSAVAIMLSGLCAIALHCGDVQVAELAMLGVGAALGFLVVNFPTGKLFLGDGGAYFLGFWTAEIVVLLLVRNPDVNAWQLLAVCAYPIIEVLFSIYRRKFVRESSPGQPDGLHLHTLVYRRVISRLLPGEKGHPWKRNAAVTCIISPCIAAMVAVAVLLGEQMAVAIMIVVTEIVAYVLVYARVVRGRWVRRHGGTFVGVEHPDPKTY
jgi:UDP-N-acetylmuramyl pentapeptide phosphotransferase/UDP-N-acetylglucosamine-1-phosphate transferase